MRNNINGITETKSSYIGWLVIVLFSVDYTVKRSAQISFINVFVSRVVFHDK